MRKALIALVALLLLLPVLPFIIPKTLTAQDIQAKYAEQGVKITDFKSTDTAAMDGAVEAYTMFLNGVRAQLYLFDDVGKLAKQTEYHRKDAGTAMVEAWNLGQQLGAAPNPNIPTFIGRNDMWLLIITTPVKTMGEKLARTFNDF